MSNDLLHQINAKLDTILHRLEAQPDRQKYLTARDVEELTGLKSASVLNRSNLDPQDPRYIPSLRFGTRRKYFERRVIERMFKLAR